MSTLRVDNIEDVNGADRRGLKTYAVICDEKAYNVDGGTFTSGAWRTRDLNTKIADPDGIVSIASNQFTLGAGDYFIKCHAPSYGISRAVARLYNVTASSVVQIGSASFTSNYANDTSLVFARITVTSSTTFELQHRSTGSKTTNGLGVQTAISDAPSIYATVEIIKEA